MTNSNPLNVSTSFYDKESQSTHKSVAEISEISFFSTPLRIFLTIIAIIGFLAIVSIPLVMHVWRKRQQFQRLDMGMGECPVDGNSLTADLADTPHNELSEGSFTITDEGIQTYYGYFGKVCLGTVTRDGIDVQVAVKMLSNDPCLMEINHIINVIKNLTYLEYHPNIVELYGACTTRLTKGKIFGFFEFCSIGTLQTYLTRFNPTRSIVSAEEGETVKEYFNDNERNVINDSLAKDLCRWSHEIASGMEYLTSKDIVIIDIATRNVLLTDDKRAKIAEFGFSRRLHHNKKYLLQEQMPLPWRFLAPESLTQLAFSEKSDVWTFGVTLWEMYSLGDLPYQGLSWDRNFPTRLERGLRLKKPGYGYCSDNTYSIMHRCWAIDSEMRPTFLEFVKLLRRL